MDYLKIQIEKTPLPDTKEVDEDLSKLVSSLAPIILQHPNEKFNLANVDDYFNNSDEYLYEKEEKYGRKLHPDTVQPMFENKVPIYYNINKQPNTDFIHITYWLFYYYNGAKRIIGLFPMGAHNADIETISVKLLKTNIEPSLGDNNTDNATIVNKYKIIEYNLSAHGDLTSYSLNNSNEYNKYIPTGIVGSSKHLIDLHPLSGRPVVYAAINSHALYNQQGVYIRFYGFGNDVTKYDPKFAITTIPHLLKKHSPIYRWDQRLGDEGVNGFQQRQTPWAEKHVSRTVHISLTFSYLAYLFYLVVPIITYQFSNNVKLTLILFILQFYIIKCIGTLIFPFIAPEPLNKDSLSNWMFPFRLY